MSTYLRIRLCFSQNKGGLIAASNAHQPNKKPINIRRGEGGGAAPPTSSPLAPRDHPASPLTSRLRVMRIGRPLRSPCRQWSPALLRGRRDPLREMTRRVMLSPLFRLKDGFNFTANVLSHGTACMKATPGGYIDRGGQIARKNTTLATLLDLRVGDSYTSSQSLRIRNLPLCIKFTRT